MSSRTPSGLIHSMKSSPYSFTIQSRNVIISRNFHRVFTCSTLNGIRAGANAFCASRSITPLSLPIE